MHAIQTLLSSRKRRIDLTLVSLVLTLALLGSALGQSTPATPSTATQAQTPSSSGQPPVAVNPKPCDVVVTAAGAMSNTCADAQQPSSAPAAGNTQAPTQPSAPATPPSQTAPQAKPAEAPNQPITKAEARELFRSVDEILQFVSQNTGLPIEHKVHRKLIARQSMEKYVRKHMKEDKDTKRMEHETLVLEKFGLLPNDYDLHAQFLRLMGEQVAAYYEPKSKSVNLLDWVQPDIQKPVLAHELTHALQDQKVDLQKWPEAGAKDDKPLPDQQEQVVEEAQAARQAVTEGQAMVELFNYSLAPLGKDVLTAPDMVTAMRAGMGDSSDSPVFAAAPMFLKETLMMPYSFGMDFVRAVLAKQGREAAFAGMLANPPVDTRQIMQPETYLAHQVVTPLTIPDLDKLVAPGYERYDFGAMGEFDIYLLARQYAPDAEPKNYYPHWRGGYYLAAHARTAPKDLVSLLYFSRWDSPEAALAFAKLYGNYTPKRYKQSSVVAVAAAQATQSSATAPGKQDASAGQNLRVFQTNEGAVRIEVKGRDVLVLENFDEATSEKVREALFATPATPDPVSQTGAAQP